MKYRRFLSTLFASLWLALWSQCAVAIGFVVHVGDKQAWLKAHPEVNPKTLKNPDGSDAKIVKVSTMKEWMAAHPDILKQRDSQAKTVLSGPSLSLTPILLWDLSGLKEPVNYYAVGIYSTKENMKTVYEKDRLADAEIGKTKDGRKTWRVPPGVLKAGFEYYFQVVAFSKSTELKDVVGGYWTMRPDAKVDGYSPWRQDAK
ncbi:MAG: hypothetical protein Q7T63_17145 [Burkholderiaceae bacterium]|nr:hypothetical protein [Burkholderiaceae bacterium]MDO9089073.1 hypothetical protein [Burkholderiaceae bacterium]